MLIPTSQKILDYINKYGRVSPKELVDYLGDISSRAVRKQLKNLLIKGYLHKIGRPPKVYYLLFKQEKQLTVIVKKSVKSIIENRYLYITPSGEEIKGWNGFIAWCNKTNQEPVKTANQYISTLTKYDLFRKKGLIDGTAKIKKTFSQVFLNKLFYLDFYSIERFGKTKLGQMLLYAKQSQNKKLINNLINKIEPNILEILKKYKIDGVLFIPPTVKREIQFMKELEKVLNLPLRVLIVSKIKTTIIVPQKTLSKLEDRIENAQKTIVLEEKNNFKNILLIDDAVGSGATMNETANQIKKRKICQGQIIGLAITGSYKGFDVISEI